MLWGSSAARGIAWPCPSPLGCQADPQPQVPPPLRPQLSHLALLAAERTGRFVVPVAPFRPGPPMFPCDYLLEAVQRLREVFSLPDFDRDWHGKASSYGGRGAGQRVTTRLPPAGRWPAGLVAYNFSTAVKENRSQPNGKCMRYGKDRTADQCDARCHMSLI